MFWGRSVCSRRGQVGAPEVIRSQRLHATEGLVIGSAIRAIAGALPDQVITNADLCDLGWTAEEIEQKTGIAERHVAHARECASDFAVSAAESLLIKSQLCRDEVDFVVFCTQTPDYLLPATACIIQDRLGLPTTCGALDANLGCSGYVYGLALARAVIGVGFAHNVLLLTGDTYTRLIHPRDRSVRTLFGDAATATWIAATERDGLGPFSFGTDGSGAKNLIVRAGALRLPASAETKREETDASGNVRTAEHLFMDGVEIFSFALERVPESVEHCLKKAGLTLDDIDLLVFHQANRYMLDHLQRKLGVPDEKMVVYLREVGNTVSSSIPLALEAMLREGRLTDGLRLLLVGFGVGYSWASCLVKWEGGSGS